MLLAAAVVAAVVVDVVVAAAAVADVVIFLFPYFLVVKSSVHVAPHSLGLAMIARVSVLPTDASAKVQCFATANCLPTVAIADLCRALALALALALGCSCSGPCSCSRS